MRKSAALLVLLILIVSDIMVAAPACAAVTKPSVPEFTWKLGAHPYDVAAATSTDFYTGETVITDGYHVENRSLEVTIKNQPYTSYMDAGGFYTRLSYKFRFNGLYEENWIMYPTYPYGSFNASHSDYTVISIPFSSYPLNDVSTGSQVDFQVQALNGHEDKIYTGTFGTSETDFYYEFVGETSNWSSTQTLTLDDSASTATPDPLPSESSPTPTTSALPSQNPTATAKPSPVGTGGLFGFDLEKTALIALVVVVAALVVAVAVLWRKVAAK